MIARLPTLKSEWRGNGLALAALMAAGLVVAPATGSVAAPTPTAGVFGDAQKAPAAQGDRLASDWRKELREKEKEDAKKSSSSDSKDTSGSNASGDRDRYKSDAQRERDTRRNTRSYSYGS